MPFTPDEFSPFGHFTPDGVAAQRYMMVDHCGFGSPQYNPTRDLGHPPIYAYPTSYEDRQQGGEVDGWWVPGHEIRIVDGRRYLKDDAPEPDREGKP